MAKKVKKILRKNAKKNRQKIFSYSKVSLKTLGCGKAKMGESKNL